MTQANSPVGEAQASGPNYWALVVAAGVGSRMASQVPKQYLPLAGKAVLAHSLDCFARHPLIAGIVVVLKAGDERWQALDYQAAKPVITAVGGDERSDSVLSGLHALTGQWSDAAREDDWVLVHDAARPCLTGEDLNRLIIEVGDDPVGGLLGLPARDTLKRVDQGRVQATLDRTQVWQAQTPQMFRLGLLRSCLAAARASGVTVTDEAMAMEQAAHLPLMIEGKPDNIKLTTSGDLLLADFILRQQARG